MSALVRKEIRLLWPSWVAALLMAFSIWLVPKNQNSASDLERMLVVIPFIACPLMLVIMTLSSFGREITSNTFSSLLAQPVPRARIWWTKTLLLAAAVGIVWTVWWFSFLQGWDFQYLFLRCIREVSGLSCSFGKWQRPFGLRCCCQLRS
jgi:ABC-type transport system involved in multi-copper enzyme maturation permease subunit